MRQAKHTNPLYTTDFYEWTQTQVKLLRSNELDKVDLEHVIEEIESLGKSERSALKNQVIRLLVHLLKIKYQPSRHTRSWDRSIGNAKIEIEKILEDNPSLKREMEMIFNEAYPHARKKASVETELELKTFSEKCPWTMKEIME